MSQPKVVKKSPATDQFPFIFGRYQLSNWTVPYFQTSMTLLEAADNLTLVSDTPGAQSLDWKLEELYQREIDWNRVSRQIVPYLTATDRPQFFNSLTIALLPLSDGGLADTFEEKGWNVPDLEKDPELWAKTCGPMVAGYYNDWSDLNEDGAVLGQLRWNPREMVGVAIDGQHRLAAIKQAVDRNNRDDKWSASQVPVILVVLAKQFGFTAPKGSTRLLEVMRRLFIDLNKHSEKVSRPRQILLDDSDPHALCTRCVVGNQLVDGVGELEKSPPRLPLSFVDWHSEQARFDEGPYVATILGLDWVVTKALGCSPLVDYTDYNAIGKQLKRLSNTLAIGLKDKDSSTWRRYRECEERQKSFHYTGVMSADGKVDGELGEIVKAFGQIWSPAITKIFSEYSPYAEIFKVRRQGESATPQFANWYYLHQRISSKKKSNKRDEDQYETFCSELEERKPPVLLTDLSEHLSDVEVFKKNNLAFNVVYQRALFLAFLEFCKLDDASVPRPGEDEDEDELDILSGEDDVEDTEEYEATVVSEKANLVAKRASQFVEAHNVLITSDPSFLDLECAVFEGIKEHRIWSGSLLDSSGNIDFTQSASARAKEILTWIPLLRICEQASDPLLEGGFDSFWAEIDESGEPVHKRLRASFNRFTSEKNAGGRILLAREEEYDADIALEECEIRMRWVWATLGLKS